MSQRHPDTTRSRYPIQIVSTDQGPRVGPYVFGRTLGIGSTGKVKLARNLETGEMVAVKIVRKDYLENKQALKRKMRREISVLKVLSHPNIMSLIDVFEIETHLFLVMEFVDGLELFEYLVRRGALPIPEALSFFQQIICGLEYCHKRLICHRDLKPENLLLDRNLNIKIADFGMTSLNPPGSLLETSCGSPHYCDPNVVSGGMYDGLKADIWSCGVILYAMVTGRLPFDDDNIQRLLQKVQSGQYHLPSDLPDDLRNLIKSMLTIDPDNRITLEQIKKHPWFLSVPPRNYLEDNFVAPSQPFPSPNPMVIQSLIDLGWGDGDSIRSELAKDGPSMEKVFYQQLLNHPMFKRGTQSVLERYATEAAAQPVGERPNTAQASGSGMASSAQTNGVSKDSAANGGSAATEAEALRERLANVTVSEGSTAMTANGGGEADGATSEEHGDKAEGGRHGDGMLVRQSSLIRIRGDGEVQARKAGEGAEEAIQTASGGNQKSWFDSVCNYLTGQGEGEEGEGNKEQGKSGKDGNS